MNEALIFDCDGTLADTMPAHYLAWVEVLRPYGIPFPEEQFYAWGGRPTNEISKALLAQAGRTDLAYLTLADAKEATFLTKLHEVRPLEKVVSIARARRGEVPMAVASGGHRHVVELTLNHLGIRSWFGALVAAEDVTRGKPEPDVFLEAARRIGAPPAICTVYEDTDFGIEAARRAGMRWVDIRRL